MNSLDMRSGGKWRVHTSYGTHYVLDLDAQVGMRVPGEGRYAMPADNDWFKIAYIQCNVGEPMYIDSIPLSKTDWSNWRLTTKVTSIEPYVKDEN